MPLPSGFTATLIWSHPPYTVSFLLELFVSWLTPPWITLLAIPSKPWRYPHKEHLSFPPFVQLICPQYHSGDTSAMLLHGHPPCLWNLRGIRGCIRNKVLVQILSSDLLFSQVWVPVPPKSVVNYSRPDTLSHPHPSPASGSTLLGTPGALRNFFDGLLEPQHDTARKMQLVQLFPFHEWGCWGPEHLQDWLCQWRS